MMVSVTPAVKNDLSALHVMNDAYAAEIGAHYPGIAPRRSIDEWMEWPTPNVMVIRKDGEYAGFAVMAIRPPYPGVMENYFADLYIVPRFRRGNLPMVASAMMVRQYPGGWTADVLIGNKVSNAFVNAMARRLDDSFNVKRLPTDYGCANRYRFQVGA